MDKYLTKRKTIGGSSSTPETDDVDKSKQRRVETNLTDLPADPGLRKRILDYKPKRDQFPSRRLQDV